MSQGKIIDVYVNYPDGLPFSWTIADTATIQDLLDELRLDARVQVDKYQIAISLDPDGEKLELSQTISSLPSTFSENSRSVHFLKIGSIEPSSRANRSSVYESGSSRPVSVDFGRRSALNSPRNPIAESSSVTPTGYLSSRRRSSIFESPASKGTQIRAATDFANLFKPLVEASNANLAFESNTELNQSSLDQSSAANESQQDFGRDNAAEANTDDDPTSDVTSTIPSRSVSRLISQSSSALLETAKVSDAKSVDSLQKNLTESNSNQQQMKHSIDSLRQGGRKLIIHPQKSLADESDSNEGMNRSRSLDDDTVNNRRIPHVNESGSRSLSAATGGEKVKVLKPRKMAADIFSYESPSSSQADSEVEEKDTLTEFQTYEGKSITDVLVAAVSHDELQKELRVQTDFVASIPSRTSLRSADSATVDIGVEMDLAAMNIPQPIAEESSLNDAATARNRPRLATAEEPISVRRRNLAEQDRHKGSTIRRQQMRTRAESGDMKNLSINSGGGTPNEHSNQRQSIIRRRVSQRNSGTNQNSPMTAAMQIVADFESRCEQPNQNRVLLKVNIPHQMTTTVIKAPENVLMEGLLRYLAAKRGFQFDDYTFAIPKTNQNPSITSATPGSNMSPVSANSEGQHPLPPRTMSTEKGDKTLNSNRLSRYNLRGKTLSGVFSALSSYASSANNSGNSISEREIIASVGQSNFSPVNSVPTGTTSPHDSSGQASPATRLSILPAPDLNVLSDGRQYVQVELDRTVQHYKEVLDVKEIVVIPEAKSYSMICVSESNVDVMIMSMVKGKLLVMAGIEEKLIERMTDDQEKDGRYMNTFLLTFRHFMTPAAVLETLIDRFNATLPENPTREDLDFYHQWKEPTQFKVMDAFECWIKHHWHDFAVNPSLREDLEFFVGQVSKCGGNFGERSRRLEELISMQIKRQKEIEEMRIVIGRSKTIQSIFMDIEPVEFAKQMCLYNFKLFKAIHPIEFLNYIWCKPPTLSEGDDTMEDTVTPNLRYFISRFDIVPKQCCELNNFFSMFAIFGGLNLSPVQRLKKTWESLSVKTKSIYEGIEKLLSPSRNMKAFRDLLAASRQPILPFLPIYLKDLTFMNDGNQSRVQSMVNFDKLRMMGQRVMEIASLVEIPYPFEDQPAIQNYLKKPLVTTDLAKLKEASMQCE